MLPRNDEIRVGSRVEHPFCGLGTVLRKSGLSWGEEWWIVRYDSGRTLDHFRLTLVK